MKHLVALCCCFVFLTASFSQIKAVTSEGDEVMLNKNGTWKYVNTNLNEEHKLDTSKVVFSKSASASFMVKSSKVDCGFYIDPKKWSFTKSGSDEDSEFEFSLKGQDGFGIVICEKTEIPLETLRNVAVDNARDAAPDVAIIEEEYRRVNNNTVLMLQMSGAVQGIKVTYLGYYFSSPKGSVQFLAYTASNLFAEYKPELEQFLNGFVSPAK